METKNKSMYNYSFEWKSLPDGVETVKQDNLRGAMRDKNKLLDNQ